MSTGAPSVGLASSDDNPPSRGSLRAGLADPHVRATLAGVAVLTALGVWCRVGGLTHGSLYRDDAWVALTSHVPWHEAWRMVGTAPGFVLLERFWVGLASPSTWVEQVPTLVASVIAIPVVAAVAWWWGLRRWSVLLVAALLAVGRIDVEYATHLKPYATDVIAGALTLWAAERWRRGGSAWPFGAVALVSLAISFSVAPVVAGCAVVMAVEGVRHRRLRTLWGPGLLVAVPAVALYWRVRPGISPQLKISWAANFVDFHSVRDIVHSLHTIVGGLIWGFIDTTPHWHVPGLSKVIVVGVVLGCVIGATAYRTALLPAISVVVAFLAAAIRLEPLGTGRTDAYLYPALALLLALGVERVVELVGGLWRPAGRPVAAAVAVLLVFLALDVAAHRPTYPGGSIAPVATAARSELGSGGGVLIEGTARWPWTLYESTLDPVHLIFSPLYNNGFAPVSNQSNVYIMPGSEIEGGYDPSYAVRQMAAYHEVLYVRTDDWPTLGDPLHAALAAAGYCEWRVSHPAGYILEWWKTGTCVAT